MSFVSSLRGASSFGMLDLFLAALDFFGFGDLDTRVRLFERDRFGTVERPLLVLRPPSLWVD